MSFQHVVVDLELDGPRDLIASGRVDRNEARLRNVTLTQDEAVTTIPQVPMAAACPVDQPAWYYDVPSAPTKIDLCENACDAVTAAGDGAELNVVAGCTNTIVVQ